MTQLEYAPSDVGIATADLVAKMIAGISRIGEARRALEPVGPAVIAGNRIIVDSRVEATLILSGDSGWWQVFNTDGTPPVWIVGAFCTTVASWTGCDD
ncbi:hypothetical protein A5722_16450 [Mycobacterium vulneris]|uniref:hypothetical protein n=1 Tax=Mycolicibacterium porcinum TaxID=39693 RepID=UPI00080AE29C|nr:hypothetical protein [Mycolicibacterium porcinum]OCB10712.1 hypothetical protein A5717_02925 [Mycolicibacterium porcinum]OCB55698.1 hypothetical protein A5722_16450 [Mycolicibacterium vulneris]OCB65221.1 hypothetical protein A5729_16990 [Mycolicibacterium vulneris]